MWLLAARAVRGCSYVLAACVLVVAAPFPDRAGLLPVPDSLPETLAAWGPLNEGMLSLILFVCLPLALGLALFVRALLTGAHAEAALAAFAVPCLLSSLWALHGYYVARGAYVRGIITILVATPPAFLVLADAIVTSIDRLRLA